MSLSSQKIFTNEHSNVNQIVPNLWQAWIILSIIQSMAATKRSRQSIAMMIPSITPSCTLNSFSTTKHKWQASPMSRQQVWVLVSKSKVSQSFLEALKLRLRSLQWPHRPITDLKFSNSMLLLMKAKKWGRSLPSETRSCRVWRTATVFKKSILHRVRKTTLSSVLLQRWKWLPWN